MPGVDLDTDALLTLRHRAARMPGLEAVLSALPGGLVHPRRGRGLEAADIRRFAQGDDPRLIDRNATARTGKLYVKQMHDERDRRVVLVADFRPSMLWGTRRAFRSVAAAEMLTLLGWQAAQAGARVGLVVLSDAEPVAVPGRGREWGMVAVIGALVAAHRAALARFAEGRDDDPPLAEGLVQVGRTAPRGAEIVVASAFEDSGPALDAALGDLCWRHTVTLLSMIDAFERSAAQGGARGTFRVERRDGTRGLARPQERPADPIPPAGPALRRLAINTALEPDAALIDALGERAA